MSGPYNQPVPDRALTDTLRDVKRRLAGVEAGSTLRGGIQVSRIRIGRYVIEEGDAGSGRSLVARAIDDPTHAVDLFASLNTADNQAVP